MVWRVEDEDEWRGPDHNEWEEPDDILDCDDDWPAHLAGPMYWMHREELE